MVYATNLTLTVVSPTRIDLSWVESGGPSTITRIERSLDNVTWAALALYHYGLPEWQDDTCTPETCYWYRIRLYAPLAGWGPYCLPECATTTEILDTQDLTETVTPGETIIRILTHGTTVPGILYGSYLTDEVVPVDSLTTGVGHRTGLAGWLSDVVTVAETIVGVLTKVGPPYVYGLSVTDHIIPVEAFNGSTGSVKILVLIDNPIVLEPSAGKLAQRVRSFIDNGEPTDHDLTYVFWPEDLAVEIERLIIGRADNHLYWLETSNPAGYWTSKDIDFGGPGVDKTLSEIVFWGIPPTPITVTVSVSLDGGDTWVWSEAVVLDRSRSGIAHPWLTGETFRVRFAANGLHLSGFQAAAMPRGREVPRP